MQKQKTSKGQMQGLIGILMVLGLITVIAGGAYWMFILGPQQQANAALENANLRADLLSRQQQPTTATGLTLTGNNCPTTKTGTVNVIAQNKLNSSYQQLAASAILVPKLDEGTYPTTSVTTLTGRVTQATSAALTTKTCPETGFVVVLGSSTTDSGVASYELTSASAIDPSTGSPLFVIDVANLTPAKFQTYDAFTNISNQAAGPIMTTTAYAMAKSDPAKTFTQKVAPLTSNAAVGSKSYGILWVLDLKDTTVFGKSDHANALVSQTGGWAITPLGSCPYGTEGADSGDVCFKSPRILSEVQFSEILNPVLGEPTSSTQPRLYAEVPSYYLGTDGALHYGVFDSASTRQSGVANYVDIALT